MNQCVDSKALHNRLNRIIGQINAINRMIDDGTACEDILIQINAAKSAFQHGDADETIKQFAKAIERFSNI